MNRRHEPQHLASRTRRSQPLDQGFLTGFLLSGLLFSRFVFQSMRYDAKEGRAHFFTAAAFSMLHGHWDVPREVLSIGPGNNGAECFLVRGKCLGYFGITPSLLRMPFVLLRGNRTYWSFPEAPFFLLGFVTVGLGVWWITRLVFAAWGPRRGTPTLFFFGFVASVASLAASPVFYLSSVTLVYEEAILWGVGFATIALACALSMWLRGPTPAKVAIVVVADILAVSARPTVGCAALFATATMGVWIVWSTRRARNALSGREIVMAVCLIFGSVIAFASAPVLTYAKFNSTSPPYAQNPVVVGQQGRLQKYSHFGGVNPAILPTKLFSALRPDTLKLSFGRPYAAPNGGPPTALWPGRSADLDYQLPDVNISATMPLSSLATLGGLVVLGLALTRSRRSPIEAVALRATMVVLASSALPIILILTYPGQGYRYFADWVPFFAVAASVGLAALARRSFTQRGLVSVLIVLSVLLIAQQVIQLGLTVREGTTIGNSRVPACPGRHDPYGWIGEVFCPA